MESDKFDLADIEKMVIKKPVRVTLPREVAYDLDRFASIQKDILGKLGCSACCSGHDIRWEFEQHFVVDQKLNIRSL